MFSKIDPLTPGRLGSCNLPLTTRAVLNASLVGKTFPACKHGSSLCRLCCFYSSSVSPMLSFPTKPPRISPPARELLYSGCYVATMVCDISEGDQYGRARASMGRSSICTPRSLKNRGQPTLICIRGAHSDHRDRLHTRPVEYNRAKKDPVHNVIVSERSGFATTTQYAPPHSLTADQEIYQTYK